jgi:hypothetical protein
MISTGKNRRKKDRKITTPSKSGNPNRKLCEVKKNRYELKLAGNRYEEACYDSHFSGQQSTWGVVIN